MRKALIAVMIVMMVSAVSAATSVISPTDNSLQEIELNSTNSYEVEKEFDGSGSSPDTVTYSWSWTEESISKTGPTANFTFDRDKGQDNTIKLVVTSNSDSDDESVSFSLRDQPEIKSTSVSDTDIDLNESDGKVDYSVDARNEFDDVEGGEPNYTWTFGNGTVASEKANFTMEYNSTGDYTLTVNVSDDQDYFSTKTVEKVDVSESGSGDEEQNNGGGGDNEQDFDEKYTFASSIDAGESKDLEFDESPVTDVSIEFGEDLDNAALSSKAQTDLPDEADEEPSDEVFEYIELEKTNFTNDDIDSVQFDFEVEKDWIENNEIKEDSITLQRYDDDSWETLDTERESEDSDYIYFSADSSGFSVFSITGEELQPDIEVTDISVSSSNINLDESVDIDVTVENSGDKEGDYTVSFDFAGESFEKEIEDLLAGESKTVSFSRKITSAGSYDIELDGQSATVTVEDPDSENLETESSSDPDSNQTVNTTGTDDNQKADEGGLPILGIALMIVFIGSLGSLGAFFYTHDEKREKAVEKMDSLAEDVKEKFGDKETQEEDFDWDGFDK